MKPILLFIVAVVFAACSRDHAFVEQRSGPPVDAFMQDNFIVLDTPVWGYRFTIVGDFNGDGRRDTLHEHFFSRLLNQETNKYYSGNEDIYDLANIAAAKDVISFMACSNCGVDTFPTGLVTGPLFIKNEGDLDGDGADEIGYVPSLPQMSYLNHYNICSYRSGQWKELYSFSMWEWELPPTPEAGRSYGFFGSDGQYMVANDDALNAKLEQDLLHFDDLVKKLPGGKVHIKTRTDYAEDSVAIVDFRKRHR